MTLLIYVNSSGVAVGIILVMTTTSPGKILVKILKLLLGFKYNELDGILYPLTVTQTLSTFVCSHIETPILPVSADNITSDPSYVLEIVIKLVNTSIDFT